MVLPGTIPISVLMPVYNAEEYLSEAIESILNQTYDKFELLIFDDGSKDGSLDIIKKYAGKDRRIKWRSRGNKGLSTTLNELLDMSKGKYLARMDSDDISRPYRFELQYKYMESHSNIDVLGSPVQIVRTREIKMKQHFDNDIIRGIRLMFRNAGIAHPTAFIRSSFIRKNDIRYDESNLGSEDYQLWVDIICKGGTIASLKKPVLDYRVVPGSMSDIHSKVGRTGIYKAKEQLLGRFGEFSEKEMEGIKHFYELDFDIDVESLFGTIRKISKLNDTVRLYDDKVLRKELALQWFWYGFLKVKHCKNYNMIKPKYLFGLGVVEFMPYICRNILDK